VLGARTNVPSERARRHSSDAIVIASSSPVHLGDGACELAHTEVRHVPMSAVAAGC
jgi:hypothetical protein